MRTHGSYGFLVLTHQYMVILEVVRGSENISHIIIWWYAINCLWPRYLILAHTNDLIYTCICAWVMWCFRVTNKHMIWGTWRHMQVSRHGYVITAANNPCSKLFPSLWHVDNLSLTIIDPTVMMPQVSPTKWMYTLKAYPAFRSGNNHTNYRLRIKHMYCHTGQTTDWNDVSENSCSWQ